MVTWTCPVTNFKSMILYFEHLFFKNLLKLSDYDLHFLLLIFWFFYKGLEVTLIVLSNTNRMIVTWTCYYSQYNNNEIATGLAE